MSICYLSSSRTDPGLSLRHSRLNSFFIGSGFIRNYLFETIDTQLLILTMPDLGNFQIKRSRHDVHYVYTQHSLVSSHMIYREKAFDHYDTILCAGPHQIAEIEKTEICFNLEKKNLVKFGYPRLDQLINYSDQEKEKSEVVAINKKKLIILIAPSWGPEGLIESGLCLNLAKQLIELGHQIIVRPHPQTIKFNRKKISEIEETFFNNPDVVVELDVRGHESLFSSDIMISDWSGVALEYALGFKKPVVFCDIPKKINNTKYLEIDMVPIEVSVRNELGVIWDTKSPINDLIFECLESINITKLDAVRKKYVYNSTKTDDAFIDFLGSLKLI